MKWIAIGLGVFAVLGAIGATVGPSTSIDYETATLEERQAWLEEQGDEMGRGLSDGLKASGLNEAQVALSSQEYDIDRKEITFKIEVKGSVRMAFPTNFSTDFQTKMCPAFRSSGLAKADIKTRFQIERTNGDIVRTDIISKAVCDRLSAFQDRRRRSRSDLLMDRHFPHLCDVRK